MDKLILGLITFCLVLASMVGLMPIPRGHMPDAQYYVAVAPQEEAQVPSAVFTAPDAEVYKIVNDRAFRLNHRLKHQAFECRILKKLSASGKTFYLVQITEKGYESDKWIIEAGDLISLF